MASQRNINYLMTGDQVKQLCDKYGKDPETIEDWELGELLDELIDQYTD